MNLCQNLKFCKNGGTCWFAIERTIIRRNYCICPSGYKGETCEVIEANFQREKLIEDVEKEPILFDYYKPKPTDAFEIIVKNIVIDHTKIWPGVLGCLAALILLLTVLYKIWKKTCNNWRMAIRFDFVLEFMSANGQTRMGSIFIRALKLHGQPQDFEVTAEEHIAHIKVVKSFRSKLEIKWPSLKLRDTKTDEIFRLPNEIKLSCLETLKLKRLMKMEYYCLPGFVREGQLTRVDVRGHYLETSNPLITVTSENK